jgi:hypothetical protein
VAGAGKHAADVGHGKEAEAVEAWPLGAVLRDLCFEIESKGLINDCSTPECKPKCIVYYVRLRDENGHRRLYPEKHTSKKVAEQYQAIEDKIEERKMLPESLSEKDGAG